MFTSEQVTELPQDIYFLFCDLKKPKTSPKPCCQCAGCWFALFPADTQGLIPLGAGAGELHVSVETTKWFIDSAEAEVIEMHRGETRGRGGGFGGWVGDEQWQVWLKYCPPPNLEDTP